MLHVYTMSLSEPHTKQYCEKNLCIHVYMCALMIHCAHALTCHAYTYIYDTHMYHTQDALLLYHIREVTKKC